MERTVMHHAMHHVMHHVLHHVMHHVLHHVMHHVMHHAMQAPIFHVNGDDVEAVVRVCRLAVDFRQTFYKVGGWRALVVVGGGAVRR